VLPMPLAAYAEDFDAAHLAALKTLLARPGVRCVELSPPAPAAGAAAGGSAARMARDALYSNLTETLIRRSCLLLAIWDGRPSPLPGGTADTVLRYLGVRTPSDPAQSEIHYVAASEDMDAVDRLVYWAPTARTSGTRARTVSVVTTTKRPSKLAASAPRIVIPTSTMTRPAPGMASASGCHCVGSSGATCRSTNLTTVQMSKNVTANGNTIATPAAKLLRSQRHTESRRRWRGAIGMSEGSFTLLTRSRRAHRRASAPSWRTRH
jgi:hypothetical protein